MPKTRPATAAGELSRHAMSVQLALSPSDKRKTQARSAVWDCVKTSNHMLQQMRFGHRLDSAVEEGRVLAKVRRKRWRERIVSGDSRSRPRSAAAASSVGAAAAPAGGSGEAGEAGAENGGEDGGESEEKREAAEGEVEDGGEGSGDGEEEKEATFAELAAAGTGTDSLLSSLPPLDDAVRAGLERAIRSVDAGGLRGPGRLAALGGGKPSRTKRSEKTKKSARPTGGPALVNAKFKGMQLHYQSDIALEWHARFIIADDEGFVVNPPTWSSMGTTFTILKIDDTEDTGPVHYGDNVWLMISDGTVMGVKITVDEAGNRVSAACPVSMESSGAKHLARWTILNGRDPRDTSGVVMHLADVIFELDWYYLSFSDSRRVILKGGGSGPDLKEGGSGGERRVNSSGVWRLHISKLGLRPSTTGHMRLTMAHAKRQLALMKEVKTPSVIAEQRAYALERDAKVLDGDADKTRDLGSFFRGKFATMSHAGLLEHPLDRLGKTLDVDAYDSMTDADMHFAMAATAPAAMAGGVDKASSDGGSVAAAGLDSSVRKSSESSSKERTGRRRRKRHAPRVSTLQRSKAERDAMRAELDVASAIWVDIYRAAAAMQDETFRKKIAAVRVLQRAWRHYQQRAWRRTLKGEDRHIVSSLYAERELMEELQRAAENNVVEVKVRRKRVRRLLSDVKSRIHHQDAARAERLFRQHLQQAKKRRAVLEKRLPLPPELQLTATHEMMFLRSHRPDLYGSPAPPGSLLGALEPQLSPMGALTDGFAESLGFPATPKPLAPLAVGARPSSPALSATSSAAPLSPSSALPQPTSPQPRSVRRNYRLSPTPVSEAKRLRAPPVLRPRPSSPSTDASPTGAAMLRRVSIEAESPLAGAIPSALTVHVGRPGSALSGSRGKLPSTRSRRPASRAALSRTAPARSRSASRLPSARVKRRRAGKPAAAVPSAHRGSVDDRAGVWKGVLESALRDERAMRTVLNARFKQLPGHKQASKVSFGSSMKRAVSTSTLERRSALGSRPFTAL
eukprot:PLAT3390.1.p1 GENE.PLAT3390.1~~PLAT3390.1.p1  ORF type:complete len:1022 (-),score=348.96 PLAT3390.1:42-3107(-)